MNIPGLANWKSDDAGAGPSKLKIPIVGDFSFSTKLILLVVVPLALTLMVVLPLTVTGLNRLASVIAADRLAGEVTVITQQFEKFGEKLDDDADDIAADPILLICKSEQVAGPGSQLRDQLDAGANLVDQGRLQRVVQGDVDGGTIVAHNEAWLGFAVRAFVDVEDRLAPIHGGSDLDADISSQDL